MIRADDRVASVLAKDERLLDVLVGASPAFAHLRNPIARKTMARLVTVEQAARIAGLDAADLVDRLNAALGLDAPASRTTAPRAVPAPAPTPAALLATPQDRIVDLDVRGDLRAGREPLRRILDAARALPADAVLRLRATFEPVPLYAVLGKQGLAHHTEQLAVDDWRVWFHRDERAPSPAPVVRAPAVTPSEVDDVIVLDVRDLEPPEPMERTLAALATLPRGKTLVQLNGRVPKFLLPRLEERGFTYEIREQAPDLVRIFIRHRQERQSTMADLELDIRIVPPRDKHPTIFRTFDGLLAGGSFTLINDHDPAPLRHQFEATRADHYAWTYVERGPVVWRVRIEKK